MNRRAKLPDAQAPGAWDPSCRHTYCAEKADNHTLHSSPLTAPSLAPPSSTTVTHCAKSASILNSLPGKLQLQDPSTSCRAWTGPIFGQGGPHRPASPDMFESSDYLPLDLEHPRQAAFFVCVEFRDSATAKKYVANVKLNGLELSAPADDSLTSKLSWCLRNTTTAKMMKKGGDDIVASMKKSRKHFGAMGRTDPKQKQNDDTRQWNRQGL
ncbi:hypothetical protein FACUT_5295 [Fusarium acutatum]|uniref:Uncharacterized protein n=1 Tax=Fusarium acutatum TaxID=78861 RepID=A0A8H4JVY1_9HYPO|nr:hypothetical protein FACUT_5295 [Fusarium acutatum]